MLTREQVFAWDTTDSNSIITVSLFYLFCRDVSLPHCHRVPVTCGSLECEVKFSLYKYKDDPQINRPLIWNRSDDEESESDEEESDDGESSLIQVSGKMKVKNLTKKTKED